jgi:hypothetical protein
MSAVPGDAAGGWAEPGVFAPRLELGPALLAVPDIFYHVMLRAAPGAPARRAPGHGLAVAD